MRRRLLLSCILTLLVVAEGTTNINDASHTRANGRWLALTTGQTYAATDRIHFAIFDVENWMIPNASAEGVLAGGAAVPPDGKGERGVFAVNTRDVTVRGRFQPDLSSESVTISPDGAHLYAVSVEVGNVLALDPAGC